MLDKLFFHLLIFCGIWSREIIGTFADEEINKSSDFLDRQKRVISHVPGEDIPVRISAAPYVVYVKKEQRISCVGSILSLYTVLTSAPCVTMDAENYRVVSSTARTRNGNIHSIREIIKRIGHQQHIAFGIGLLIVNPPFVFTLYCQAIRLHTGPLVPGTVGKIHGWGYNFRSVNRGTNIPEKLRSIQVPIIPHQNCVDVYRPYLVITDKEICTYDLQRHSGHIDSGAGLIVDGHLAGVFLWNGPHGMNSLSFPDVFASLEDSYYNQWITTHVQNIDLYYQNH